MSELQQGPEICDVISTKRYLICLRNVKLFIVVQQTPGIWFFFNSIQNSHVHEPSKLVEIWSICMFPQRKT